MDCHQKYVVLGILHPFFFSGFFSTLVRSKFMQMAGVKLLWTDASGLECFERVFTSFPLVLRALF